jgi:hypothetical protein
MSIFEKNKKIKMMEALYERFQNLNNTDNPIGIAIKDLSNLLKQGDILKSREKIEAVLPYSHVTYWDTDKTEVNYVTAAKKGFAIATNQRFFIYIITESDTDLETCYNECNNISITNNGFKICLKEDFYFVYAQNNLSTALFYKFIHTQIKMAFRFTANKIDLPVYGIFQINKSLSLPAESGILYIFQTLENKINWDEKCICCGENGFIEAIYTDNISEKAEEFYQNNRDDRDNYAYCYTLAGNAEIDSIKELEVTLNKIKNFFKPQNVSLKVLNITYKKADSPEAFYLCSGSCFPMQSRYIS